MKNRINIVVLISLLLIIGCSKPQSEEIQTANAGIISGIVSLDSPDIKHEEKSEPAEFERTAQVASLKAKIKKGEPLFAHLLVPLCDNEHQGIVPVNSSLGDGMSLRTNLYWGAGYGIKNHFKRNTVWKTLKEIPNPSENVLERVIFFRKFPNGAKVYLIADAYRGDRMKACLTDYFQALAGVKSDSIQLEGNTLAVFGNADLIAFNGHNGLMDEYVEFIENEDNRIKDAVAIGCISYRYFHKRWMTSKGYPLLGTTGLMAPEAYVFEAVIDTWSQGGDGSLIRKNAGIAYNKYQRCGIRGATNLFQTGWE